MNQPPKIDLLPEHLIDQIKAGEVIERPGNLLKEILENAVDAGATRLEITIKNNGLDLICLKDNGHGMRLNDLPLAFSRHATSKISAFEDLYKLHSYGFRGEALASIAAVSKLQCISKIESETNGSEIRIEGGRQVLLHERSTPGVQHGTELVVQELFQNTPARLKFIQSATSEKQFIKKIIFSFVLSQPHVEFHIKLEDLDKEIYPAAPDLKTRLEHMVPKGKEAILFNERFYENIELRIFLIPGHFKVPVKWQNVYINDRLILDKQLHRVLSNSLLAGFGSDDFHYLAFFRLPSDHIDVNVHPNKTIIKCFESSKMISLLSSTVKEMMKGDAPRPAANHASMMPLLDSETIPQRELLQERHSYNMEGIFSPHGLSQESSSFHWIDQFFLHTFDGHHFAVNAAKLIQYYIDEKIKMTAVTIPLLVSEPYPATGVPQVRIQELIDGGLEVEFLTKDTLVMRGIPEWMNGFPLREILPYVLSKKAITEIRPVDWSQSTWEEILSYFSLSFMLENKICLDLTQTLREKLK